MVRGRGASAVLVREPVEWTLTWVGLNRLRKTNTPFLMAGVVPLVEPFSFTGAPYGLRSDAARRPGTVDLLAADTFAVVESFVLDDALPVLDSWTPERLADRAEANFALPAGERGHPEFSSAAGWRAVNDSGSPVEPAREAAELLRAREAEDLAGWYESLVMSFEEGGRPRALEFLEEQRHAGLTRMKVW